MTAVIGNLDVDGLDGEDDTRAMRRLEELASPSAGPPNLMTLVDEVEAEEEANASNSGFNALATSSLSWWSMDATPVEGGEESSS